MGYGAVILVIGTIIISGILLLTVESATSDADDKVNEYHYKELARNAAVTGLELTVRRLAASKPKGSWTATWASSNEFSTTSYGNGGSFRTEITPIGNPIGDTVDVTARGFSGSKYNFETSQTVPISQVIKAR